MAMANDKTDKGLAEAAKRFNFEVAKAPETAKVDPMLDQPQPLPAVDELPARRQPRAMNPPPQRQVPYRRTR
jgi:hypothetical protein